MANTKDVITVLYGSHVCAVEVWDTAPSAVILEDLREDERGRTNYKVRLLIDGVSASVLWIYFLTKNGKPTFCYVASVESRNMSASTLARDMLWISQSYVYLYAAVERLKPQLLEKMAEREF